MAAAADAARSVNERRRVQDSLEHPRRVASRCLAAAANVTAGERIREETPLSAGQCSQYSASQTVDCGKTFGLSVCREREPKEYENLYALWLRLGAEPYQELYVGLQGHTAGLHYHIRFGASDTPAWRSTARRHGPASAHGRLCRRIVKYTAHFPPKTAHGACSVPFVHAKRLPRTRDEPGSRRIIAFLTALCAFPYVHPWPFANQRNKPRLLSSPRKKVPWFPAAIKQGVF